MILREQKYNRYGYTYFSYILLCTAIKTLDVWLYQIYYKMKKGKAVSKCL